MFVNNEIIMTNLVAVVTSFAVGVTTALLLRSHYRSIFAQSKKIENLRDTKYINTKFAIVVRSNLKMGKGKTCSQCAHAATSCYQKALKRSPQLLQQWEDEGEPTLILKSKGTIEDELFLLAKEAAVNGIVSCVIRDAGRTQIESGTATVVGIGPGENYKIDRIVGDLKLY